MEEPADYVKPTVLKEKPEDGESLADYFVFYLERDVLGKLANLHLALCDKLGQFGPKHEDCIFLSHLQSVAVDFAKHGECVSKDEYKGIEELIDAWPDFFEKPWKKITKSNGILGKLFRDINNEKAVEELLRDDWMHSINLRYNLDEKILALVKDKATMHSYLQKVFR